MGNMRFCMEKAEEKAAAEADYKDGMAVFVMAESDMMIDTSLDGQKFKYVGQYVGQ